MKELSDAVIVFTIFILPIWLFLHYRFKTAQVKYGVADEDLQRLDELQVTAAHLQERVQALESILDTKVPDWRRKS